ncbi:hypothetical protein J2T20_002399 [Paenibacillus wynnii]|nr:hypothetical protein [Paenibacillus wynnii]
MSSLNLWAASFFMVLVHYRRYQCVQTPMVLLQPINLAAGPILPNQMAPNPDFWILNPLLLSGICLPWHLGHAYLSFPNVRLRSKQLPKVL